MAELITIERATPEDAEALTALQVIAFHNDDVIYPGVGISGPPGYDDVAVTLEKIQEEESYKVLYDGKIVGGAVVYLYEAGHHHLDILYIDPAYHGRGIGSAVMQFLDQTYPDAKMWDLHTPLYATRNHRFYEKFGFVNVGEATEPDGFKLIHYQKTL